MHEALYIGLGNVKNFLWINILITTLTLSYTLTEQATTRFNEFPRKYVAEVLITGPLHGKWTQESRFRIFIWVFFYTDTFLRLTTFALFVHVTAFQPWNWIVLAVVFVIHCYMQWGPAMNNNVIESVFDGFVSMFSNNAFLDMGDYDTESANSRSIKEIIFDLLVITFCAALSVYAHWHDLNTAFVVLIVVMLALHLLVMNPSIDYMIRRTQYIIDWERESIDKLNERQCSCGNKERASKLMVQSGQQDPRTLHVDKNMQDFLKRLKVLTAFEQDQGDKGQREFPLWIENKLKLKLKRIRKRLETEQVRTGRLGMGTETIVVEMEKDFEFEIGQPTFNSN